MITTVLTTKYCYISNIILRKNNNVGKCLEKNGSFRYKMRGRKILKIFKLFPGPLFTYTVSNFQENTEKKSNLIIRDRNI
jgi:hypothetical protein